MSAARLSGYRSLARHALTSAAWHSNRGRLLLAILGVGLGVALGVAVHLINASAIGEFTTAARTLSGDADLVVRGPLQGFDESVYPAIARLAGVDVASPALDFDLRVPGHRPLHLIAVDAFRALRIQPALLGSEFTQLHDLLESDAIVLSQAAAEELGLRAGAQLTAQAGTQTVALRVIAVLPAAASAQRIAFADIATAQWRLQRLGVVDRIDIRLAAGADAATLAANIAAVLPPGVQVTDADAQSRQAVDMTRAYRVNLNMLALVALFTGSFLVFATQALTIVQRRGEIAILRVLGLTRGGVMRILLTESVLIGAVGSALGLAAGFALASFALQRFGGDLGAGYFSGGTTELQHDPLVLAGYFVLGIAAAVGGCALPAWVAASSDPAPALKAASALESAGAARPHWPGFALLALAVPLALLPAITDLPLGGYAAVAALLAGALWLAPVVAQFLLQRLPSPRDAVALIAVQQLRGANSQLGISISAIVVSFSLMAAMLIMIGSFRGSLEDWLRDILPADAYLRAGGAGQTGFLDASALRAVAALPAVARVSGVRIEELRLGSGRVPITLLARDFDPAVREAPPLLAGRPVSLRSDLPPVWISESAADLYGWSAGNEIELPLAGRDVRFAIAGVWRDYTRQNGTLLIERARYVAATGDERVNDVWVWLGAGKTVSMLSGELKGALGGAGLVDVRNAASIRDASLALFDRTFAVTYVLEAVAVLIGLFGISVGFSSQVLARRAEFGMLRHVGVTRGQIAALLGIEGLLAGGIGVAYGLVTGTAISMVLIHVINRQSFHLSMDLHLPVLPLVLLSIVLVLAATATAVLSGRRAMTGQPIAGVREDW